MEIDIGFENFSTLDESDLLLYGNMVNNISSKEKPFLKEKPNSLLPTFYKSEKIHKKKICSNVKRKRKNKYLSVKNKDTLLSNDLKKIRTIKVKTRNSSLKNNSSSSKTRLTNFYKKKIKNFCQS